jgi:hypothetical protein
VKPRSPPLLFLIVTLVHMSAGAITVPLGKRDLLRNVPTRPSNS